MSTAVSVNTYAHTVTYVTTKMLLSLKEIIRLIGLDPAKITDEWTSLELAISTWLDSKHLRQVTLEVFDRRADALVTRWDLDVVYGYSGDGSLWTDTDALRYSIAKAGAAPSGCNYRFLLLTWPNEPKVPGWSSTTYRSTDGFKRYGVGATIGGDGISTETSYWRK